MLLLGSAFLAPGLGYLLRWPGVFLKKADGTIPAWGQFLWLPAHLVNRLALFLQGTLSKEEPFHEIVPGLFLGRRPWRWDERAMSPLGIRSVLDLTSEFPEASFLRNLPCYRCIPLLDGTPPTPDQLQDGVGWIAQRLKEGPVYVHCALGHGRSATFIAAHLLASGKAGSVGAAAALLRAKRPGASPNKAQWAAVERLFPRN